MEKSRAIELLKLAVPIKALTQQEYADFVEAVNMGMDALEQPTSPDTIDRKAALDALRRCQTYLYDARDPELKIELSSAEAAINNLSTIQPEKAQPSQEDTTKGTTSDTISRTEVVEHLRRMLEATVPNTDYDEGFVDGVEFGVSTVSTMPTIQPQSTTGQLNDGAQSTVRSTDLIDRQQALDILDDYNISVENGELEAYSRDRKRMCELPPAQPELQWIPVSERLPEEPGCYIITANDGVGHRTTFAKFQKKAKSWELTGARSYWRVIAWMPLPEPYAK